MTEQKPWFQGTENVEETAASQPTEDTEGEVNEEAAQAGSENIDAPEPEAESET